ncbi:GntR family transcriptional regulator [Alkalihalobacillus alcalophilus ATCC 27647 = CGMCC 1.3604]|jgi:DNA-binding transcriptional regulator YhcF (GntR family)|uniref:GntR family transcriptional regulator n=1 Tax=Alkalihalobacillus alcalophilus ATCC 27647 = CGMCC 1.3604 TaxID=1218173 RepID=A0A094XCG6_ALKAL|nr:GntR family transcriptional regulator [Alkalihalobacillus alcalophilus]KGA96495.1 GntR family transcriptional regulator [Alkalihalobacillus alcalophilus ATCC 27647 = CGMCC 1.3604]MED1562298.1 GntR family transcriptional regulator [Alkalihalobacillus alcalophilus]THG88685.1 GntR family transcriptional regulator [Alkalihalobacillus alcalophilus ATCC 27647 = CGMCC 1.3604]
MRSSLDDNRPIFQQIKEMIEDEIVNGELKEGEQVPSTNQLVAHYKINPATVLKGFNQLVDSGILYKKRGVGMFVAEGAYQMLRENRKQAFRDEFVWRMLQEAKQLGITAEEIKKMIDSMGRDES